MTDGDRVEKISSTLDGTGVLSAINIKTGCRSQAPRSFRAREDEVGLLPGSAAILLTNPPVAVRPAQQIEGLL